MKIRYFLACLVMACGASLSVAPANAASNDASKYVERLGTQAVAVITDKSASKDQKQVRLERIFADNVDIVWVGKFVMGRFWRTASEDQKKRYLHEYQKFLITHYASRFSEYSSGSFTVTGTKQDGENEYTVSMEMQGGDKAQPVLVDYRVRRNGGSFKVFDVIVEGVSMITTQRSEFGAVLNEKGIDHLISLLASKSLPMN